MPVLLQNYKRLFENDEEVYAIYNKGTRVWPVGDLGPSAPDYTEPFYVENTDNESKTLTIKMDGTSSYHANPVTIEISTNRSDWELLGTTAFGTDLTYTVNSGQKLYLRSETIRWGSSSYNTGTIITGLSKVGGNIMSLLYGSNFTGNETTFPTNSTAAFKNLFYESTVVDSSELLLPATVLTMNCYQRMFYECDSLTSVPELPATTLADYCYEGMFYGCNLLTTAPELPAATLMSNSYANMFYNCRLLTYVKCMATSLSAYRCVYRWLTGIVLTGTFVCAQGMSQTWPTGSSGIPTGWTVEEV